MINNIITEKLFSLIEPIVKEKDIELYHIEYIKEFGENFLRIYIDSPNGITLDDCEKVSRPISDILDVEDPINESYYLEVSSPGIERVLYTDNHLSRYIGSTVLIKLSKLFNGKKQFEGTLSGFDQEQIAVNTDNDNIKIPRDKIKTINLKGEV
jgi:ribosome maturation factor RimP